jgi:hypothetical protein
MTCLDDEEAVAFAQGRLSAEERAAIEAHLDGCATCRTLVAELARLEPAPPSLVDEVTTPAWTPAPGARIGRYALTRVLGAGTAGIIYEGDDPELARKVAIKILRPVAGRDSAAERERLLHEARSMARLSHPHVVAVHDVGTQDDCVYLVRECVDGVSLDVWLATTRSWREVVDVFVAAGRGLAAAHAAGLVHQDFKPENVLVGRDGSVRVTDFGLARALDAPGERAGTPAFMAPELNGSQRADARADQFSFCVALWWALFGQHPLRPGTQAGPISGAASGRVPAAVATTLQRGLHADPSARHPHMNALLDALLASAGPRRLRVKMIAIGALALSAGAIALWPRPSVKPTFVTSCDERNPATPGGSDVGPCVHVLPAPQPWAAAQAQCREQGGYLASCVSVSECDRLVERTSGMGPAWIGLSNLSGGAGWQWSTGEPLSVRLAESRWGKGRGPTSDRFGCVALGGGTPPASASWTVEPCDRALPAVCERLAWHSSSAGHAYRVLPVPLTWAEAGQACQRVSGHLATITDAAEQAFVEHAFFDRGSGLQLTLWLGGTDLNDEGRFRWVTAEPFRYQRFHHREPDNRDGAQHCLVVQAASRRWHDRDCEYRYPVLCERDPR